MNAGIAELLEIYRLSHYTFELTLGAVVELTFVPRRGKLLEVKLELNTEELHCVRVISCAAASGETLAIAPVAQEDAVVVRRVHVAHRPSALATAERRRAAVVRRRCEDSVARRPLVLVVVLEHVTDRVALLGRQTRENERREKPRTLGHATDVLPQLTASFVGL